MYNLKKQWVELAAKYTQDSKHIEEIWNEIESAYSSQTRFYHTLSHVQSMIEHIQSNEIKLSTIDTLLFATWFHDIVYDILRFDNEEQSSEYAILKMKKLNVPEEIINKTSKLILKTKNHVLVDSNEDIDTQFFLDIDLSVLGTPLKKYQHYMDQIRLEYKTYNDLIYKEGRRNVLKKILEMPSIFRTSEFRSKYEEQARSNILFELKQ